MQKSFIQIFMKRSLLLVLVSFLFISPIFSQVSGEEVSFSLSKDEILFPKPLFPHAPIVFPQATLDDHTLYITRSVGAELLEVRQNDVVVYQTLITTDNPTIILPESITGDCEIILYCPVFTFVAQVEC